MFTSTKRRRTSAEYIAMGLAPDLVGHLLEQLEEEGAVPVWVGHDAEGAAVVVFRLAAWDSGTWLTVMAQRFGCGLAPCRSEA